eukprot:TRINITY_DN23508_c0_g1_i2.p1 TRINITY_DN23508_c0_g1~~TRINITY_DN23508_c0_g1_i2.p1  ORF type:complete len:123 (+),score=16.04 TRINITY_DN23508_c0_g1_i2:326-694(+)
METGSSGPSFFPPLLRADSRRAYHKKEAEYLRSCLNRGNQEAGFHHLASRWAVKEATYKAFGNWRIDFREIRVDSQGRVPKLILEGAAAEKAEELKLAGKHVSISHDGDYAIAHVILEGPGS